jgi:acyl-CoA thioesterase
MVHIYVSLVTNMGLTLKELIKQGENSPFYQLLNIKIDEVRESYARLSITIDERHIQLIKTVHGGVIASLADSAAAWAIYSSNELEGIPVTVEMKINFFKPIDSGKLIAEARNVHKGSKIFVGDVEVKNDKNDLIAKSLVTYYLVKDAVKQ